MKKIVLPVVVLAAVFAAGFYGWQLFAKTPKPPAEKSSTQEAAAPAPAMAAGPTTIRLLATGDWIAHDSVNTNAKTGDNYEYSNMVKNMKPFFDKTDIRFCNQATPAGGVGFGLSGYPTFNAPTEFNRDMAELGCNLINHASNHSYDKGQPVIDAMLDSWKAQPKVLATAGANRSAEEQAQVKYFDVKGTKFAFLAYTTYSNIKPPNNYGVNMYSNDLAKKQLDEAKTKATVTIVSMRWGTEYSPDINAQQDQIAQFLADNGATIVLGHGPHVLQPVKLIKSVAGQTVPVWFSLGNFLNTQIPAETLFSGLAVIDINVTAKNINIKYLPIYMHYEWTAAEKASGALNKRRNLELFTLDNAAEPIGRSLVGTTADAQRARIESTLNKFTKVVIINDKDF